MKAACGGCNRGIDLANPSAPYDVNTMCRLCWLYHNNPDYRSQWHEEPQLPSLAQQAMSFAGAAIKHIATGAKSVSQEELDRRLAICNGCDKFVGGRCSLCGCSCNVKASWLEQNCPIQKW